jgi:DNA phosphorothioation-associated DGQHR protein 1
MTYPLLVPAIKVQQPLGAFWAVSLPAAMLRKCVSLDPTRIESVDRSSFLYKLIGNQRDASIPRTKEIARYIDSVESAFPNSIILGANHTEAGPLPDTSELRWGLKKIDDRYYIEIPSDGKAASIIDGQHRLLGFDHAMPERQGMELLCAVYFDLPLAYQAYLFATININQRKVDKSLAYEQFGYNLDTEEPKAWAPDKLAVFLTRKLNLDPASPFYQHIKLAPLNADLVINDDDADKWQVSTACVVEGILSLISSKPPADRDDLHAVDIKARDRKLLASDSSPLRDEYRNGADEVILGIIRSFFQKAQTALWDGANEKSYIYKTIGVSALFDVLRYLLLKYERSKALEQLSLALEAASRIDFSDSFYQASGKGRVRVKNVILRAAKEISGSDLPKADASAYAIYAQTTGAYR